MSTRDGNHSLIGETHTLATSSPLIQVTSSQCFRKSPHDPLFSPGRWSDAWGLKFSDNLVQILEPVAEGWTESSFQVIATVVS
jgi:hypothetical protein